MFERREAGAGPDTESELAAIRIDSTVFETFSSTPHQSSPRIVHWLGTWAGRS